MLQLNNVIDPWNAPTVKRKIRKFSENEINFKSEVLKSQKVNDQNKEDDKDFERNDNKKDFQFSMMQQYNNIIGKV